MGSIPGEAVMGTVGPQFVSGTAALAFLLFAEAAASTGAVCESALVYIARVQNMAISIGMLLFQIGLSYGFIFAMQAVGWPLAFQAAGPAAALLVSVTLTSVIKSTYLSRLLQAGVAGWRWPMLWAVVVAGAVGAAFTALPHRYEWAELLIGEPAIARSVSVRSVSLGIRSGRSRAVSAGPGRGGLAPRSGCARGAIFADRENMGTARVVGRRCGAPAGPIAASAARSLAATWGDRSVSEMPHAREHHGQPDSIGRRDPPRRRGSSRPAGSLPSRPLRPPPATRRQTERTHPRRPPSRSCAARSSLPCPPRPSPSTRRCARIPDGSSAPRRCPRCCRRGHRRSHSTSHAWRPSRRSDNRRVLPPSARVSSRRSRRVAVRTITRLDQPATRDRFGIESGARRIGQVASQQQTQILLCGRRWRVLPHPHRGRRRPR